LAAKKNILVPHSFTAADLPSLKTSSQQFARLSNAEVYEAEKLNLVEWIHKPQHRRDRGVVRQIRSIGIRGLSCKLGEPLAVAVQQKELWAQVMLAHIQMRRESASATAPLQAADVLLFQKASAVYAATIL
jgi:hypothetical protein